MSIYIVIPTYNEKENLPNLVAVIAENLKNYQYQILIVDDNSPDGTGQIAENLKEKYPVEVLHRSGKLGIGSAYIAGFKQALKSGADLIFEMDADFSHRPEDLPRMIEAAKESDMVIGSRKIKGGRVVGWNWRRHFYSNGAMFVARLFLGLKTHDVTAGFRCYKKEVLQKINLDSIQSNGYAFQEEMLYRVEKAGFIVKEVPVVFPDRRLGQSKLNKKDIIEFFKTIFRLRFNLHVKY
ncbi:MAG TPA: polyprenol monophosphomannose synthase [bacterium]|nr:polyprenol monophosphomannose synthase [bacterium]